MHKIEQLSAELGVILTARNWRVTTAESCTGGGLAQAITAIPSSSMWFELGFVTYSNQAKQQQLGVSEGLLQAQGAVSNEVVLAMVEGALGQSGADMGVAISGIAGPGGGTTDKPVGTVWIAWGLSQGAPFGRLYHLQGERHSVREQAVEKALDGLIELAQKSTV